MNGWTAQVSEHNAISEQPNQPFYTNSAVDFISVKQEPKDQFEEVFKQSTLKQTIMNMNGWTAQVSEHNAISEQPNQPFYTNSAVSFISVKQEPRDQIEEVFIKEEVIEDENPNDKKLYHDLLQASVKEEFNTNHNVEPNLQIQSTENFEEIFIKEEPREETTGLDLSEDENNQNYKTITQHLCPVCEEGFTQNIDLLEHMKLHCGVKTYPCPVCEQLFTHKLVLKNHITEDHSLEKGYICPVCKKGFNFKRPMLDHMKSHGSDGTFQCPKCNKKFLQLLYLKRHMSTHNKEEEVHCKICNKTFSRQAHLKYHMVSHEDIKKFTCSVCNLKFLRPNHLKNHMETHNDEKQHECEVCKKKFLKKYYLTKHLKIHTNSKKS